MLQESRFDTEIFTSWAKWFSDFCKRMEKSGLPAMPAGDADGLLSVNLHMQIAADELAKGNFAPARSIIEINNGQHLAVSAVPGGSIEVKKYGSNGHALEADGFIITPGDLVTLLNWYRFQKMLGNDSLVF